MAAYDGISFAPPDGVRSACSRGIALREEGYGGDGLQPATVAWARRLASGESITPEKARKMNAWFARHGASPEENRARREDKTSPAWVAWLLWGGDAGRSWSAKLVKQMDARDKAARTSRTMQGAAVALAIPAPGGDPSPWNVLAYEVALEGRGNVALSREDFDQCVENFTRWGKPVPVVLYHADTDAGAHPLSREAHAWITDMRVGSMLRAGKMVATLEARFRWVNADTRASVERGALAFGSVTLVQNGVDEETGEAVGSFLWSFSLTNNPALVDIPRIAAERIVASSRWYGEIEDAEDVRAMLCSVLGLPALSPLDVISRELDRLESLVSLPEEQTGGVDADDVLEAIREAMQLPVLTPAADVIASVRRALASPSGDASTSAGNALPMSRGQAPASVSRMENLMQEVQFIALAARLGIASANEADAQRVILSRAEESHATRKQLGLSADAGAKDVEAKITALAAESAKVAVLSAENEALKVRESERSQRELSEHIDALCADPTLAKARPALEGFACANPAAFAKAYPKPVSLGANADLTRRVTAEGSEKPTDVSGKRATRHNDAAHELAMKTMSEKPGTTYEVALRSASRALAQKGQD